MVNFSTYCYLTVSWKITRWDIYLDYLSALFRPPFHISNMKQTLWTSASLASSVYLSPPLPVLKAERQSGGRLRQSLLDERRGDPPSMATVPPGHLSLGAVQQEGSQHAPADSLFGNAAHPRSWWANDGGRADSLEDRQKKGPGQGKPPEREESH